ncbi:MAG TPA: hypothetical protein VGM83_22465 [Devosiaceae bacterium]|jgi:hypothetical protein
MQDTEITPGSARLRETVLGSPSEIRDFLPVLKWLLVNCVVVLAFLVLWYFGLITAILNTDRTRVSLLIAAIFVLTAFHCLFQTYEVSRELVISRRNREIISRGSVGNYRAVDGRVFTESGIELEAGIMASHIANLIRKATLQDHKAFDQTLLLRALADKLRNREKLGLFVSEALLRLALLGTAIGFILMLIPISQLNSFDAETLRTALTGMTTGMAVALNVTVSGIASALVLKFEYYLLDGAIGELFDVITETTEVNVVPALIKDRA